MGEPRDGMLESGRSLFRAVEESRTAGMEALLRVRM
jgi:hypothetical protein